MEDLKPNVEFHGGDQVRHILISAAVAVMGMQAQAQSFASGAAFNVNDDYGRYTLQCSSTEDSVQILQCQRRVMNPVGYDSFVGPQVDADTVVLQSDFAKPGGSTVSQTLPYANGQSQGQFNLNTNTIFQSPLLNLGTNQVTYILKKGDTVVKQGTFTVPVTYQATRQCAPLTNPVPGEERCEYAYSSCAEYFRKTSCQ